MSVLQQNRKQQHSEDRRPPPLQAPAAGRMLMAQWRGSCCFHCLLLMRLRAMLLPAASPVSGMRRPHLRSAHPGGGGGERRSREVAI